MIICAIMGCELHARDGHHQAIRETWGADLAGWADLKFFVGRGSQALQPDEIRLDVPDEKDPLIWKVEAILRWCVDHGYSSILKVNTNTYVNVAAVKRTGHEAHDYAGSCVGTLGQIYSNIPGVYGFIQGSASWLSASAARIAVDCRVAEYAQRIHPSLLRYAGWISPYPHSEDLWIGQVLTPYLAKLSTCIDRGYGNGPLSFWSQSNFIKLHKLGEWMRRLHEVKHDVDLMRMVDNEYPKGWQT